MRGGMVGEEESGGENDRGTPAATGMGGTKETEVGEGADDWTHRADLAAFVGEDDARARAAFDRLSPTCRPFLARYLYRTCGVTDAARRDDLEQTILLRVWGARRNFQPRGRDAWFGYIRQAAYRCFLDDCRRRHAPTLPAAEEVERIPDRELGVAEVVLSALDAGELDALADQTLLDDHTPLDLDGSTRGLLAAQLFYLDGEGWEDVANLLTMTDPTRPVTRERLDDWLTDPRVIRRLAFRQVYWENRRLARYLLDAARESGEQDNAIAAVIDWRYRYGLLPEQIRQRNDCQLPVEKLMATLDRCVARLPFTTVMEEFLARLRRGGTERLTKWLASNHLWQRLAFAYRYADHLMHRDILDRCQPPAKVAGFDLNAGHLNVWLANARLLARISRARDRRDEEDEREGVGDVGP